MLLVVPGALLASSLAACGGSDDSGSDGGSGGNPLAGSRLADALAAAPAEATSVEFVDRAALAERYGVDDVAPDADEDERTAYATALVDAPAATELASYVVQMADAAFSELDLEWQATVDGPDEMHAQVWRVRDDLDLDAVADDLADAGYTASGSADAQRFTADLSSVDSATGLIGGRYPQTMLDVAVVPDDHVIVSGASTDAVVDAISGAADSLAGSGAFDDVLDSADPPSDLEYAELRRGDDTCGVPAAAGPDSEEAADSDAQLGTAVASGWFTSGEGDDRGVLLFGDGDAAAADADQRETYLADFAEFYGLDIDFAVTQDDDAVRVTSDAADARTVVSALQRNEGPLACEPA